MLENYPPYQVTTPSVVSDGQVGFYVEYAFDKSWVAEPEGEPMTYSVIFTPNLGWGSCTDNSTHYLCSGIPADNTAAQNYTYQITITDGHNDVANYTFQDTFEIIPNLSPTIGVMADQNTTVPEGITWSYGSTLINDPENQSLT